MKALPNMLYVIIKSYAKVNIKERNNNNNSNNSPKTRKYWVDVQPGIVLSHEKRGPL